MSEIQPTLLQLKDQLQNLQNLGNITITDRQEALERIADALIGAFNDTERALNKKIGGTGDRSFGGTVTLTPISPGSAHGVGSVSFTHSLPDATYEVYLAPFGTNFTQYFNYENRSVSGFDVETWDTGDATMFWFVIY